MTSVVTNLAPAHAIIQVVHSGVVSHADMQATLKRVGALVRETGTWHVMTDCTDLLDFPSYLNLMSLVEVVQHSGVDPTLRHALVWPHDREARLDFDFVRTAEQNGGIHAKTFADRESAIAWLDSQASPAG